MSKQRRRRICSGADRGPTRTENSGFFITDRLARVAKVVLMIEIHACHQRAVGIERIDGIEPPAESNFQYRYIDFSVGKCEHRRKRAELEIGEQSIAACGLDALECRAQH